MRPQLHWAIALVLLLLRGVLLWIVIPAGFVAWLFFHSWIQRATLGGCLAWYDVNLIAFLQRVLLRQFIPKPTVEWVPVRAMTDARLHDLY
jgi:hypothetical protein